MPSLTKNPHNDPENMVDMLGLETRCVGQYKITGTGQHRVPVELMKELYVDGLLSEEIAEQFDKSQILTIKTKYAHTYAGHAEYNSRLRPLLRGKIEELLKNGYDLSKELDADKMKHVIKELDEVISKSPDPYVKWFDKAVREMCAEDLAKYGRQLRIHMAQIMESQTGKKVAIPARWWKQAGLKVGKIVKYVPHAGLLSFAVTSGQAAETAGKISVNQGNMAATEFLITDIVSPVNQEEWKEWVDAQAELGKNLIDGKKHLIQSFQLKNAGLRWDEMYGDCE